ncbi:hypothetical protein PIB30_094036 [Stylosanthes scabra]|uniref:Uncharacterized protein n=1 Tax=Stylosanthes scabra TaxID=79078 RepID=A0ABU6UXU6_9FABA|nr:hypothetical protein [Stylosanthes scabra]
MRPHAMTTWPHEPYTQHWESLSRSFDCTNPPCDGAVTKSHYGFSLSPSHRCTPLHVPSHKLCARAVPPCELTVGRVALGPNCIFRRAPAHFSPYDRTGPKTDYNGPPNRACDRTSGPRARAAKFGAEVAKESARNEKIAKKSLKARSKAYALKIVKGLSSTLKLVDSGTSQLRLRKKVDVGEN